jgi:hypothetical protein
MLESIKNPKARESISKLIENFDLPDDYARKGTPPAFYDEDMQLKINDIARFIPGFNKIKSFLILNNTAGVNYFFYHNSPVVQRLVGELIANVIGSEGVQVTVYKEDYENNRNAEIDQKATEQAREFLENMGGPGLDVESYFIPKAIIGACCAKFVAFYKHIGPSWGDPRMRGKLSIKFLDPRSLVLNFGERTGLWDAVQFPLVQSGQGTGEGYRYDTSRRDRDTKRRIDSRAGQPETPEEHDDWVTPIRRYHGGHYTIGRVVWDKPVKIRQVKMIRINLFDSPPMDCANTYIREALEMIQNISEAVRRFAYPIALIKVARNMWDDDAGDENFEARLDAIADAFADLRSKSALAVMDLVFGETGQQIGAGWNVELLNPGQAVMNFKENIEYLDKMVTYSFYSSPDALSGGAGGNRGKADSAHAGAETGIRLASMVRNKLSRIIRSAVSDNAFLVSNGIDTPTSRIKLGFGPMRENDPIVQNTILDSAFDRGLIDKEEGRNWLALIGAPINPDRKLDEDDDEFGSSIPDADDYYQPGNEAEKVLQSFDNIYLDDYIDCASHLVRMKVPVKGKTGDYEQERCLSTAAADKMKAKFGDKATILQEPRGQEAKKKSKETIEKRKEKVKEIDARKEGYIEAFKEFWLEKKGSECPLSDNQILFAVSFRKQEKNLYNISELNDENVQIGNLIYVSENFERIRKLFEALKEHNVEHARAVSDAKRRGKDAFEDINFNFKDLELAEIQKYYPNIKVLKESEEIPKGKDKTGRSARWKFLKGGTKDFGSMVEVMIKDRITKSVLVDQDTISINKRFDETEVIPDIDVGADLNIFINRPDLGINNLPLRFDIKAGTQMQTTTKEGLIEGELKIKIKDVEQIMTGKLHGICFNIAETDAEGKRNGNIFTKWVTAPVLMHFLLTKRMAKTNVPYINAVKDATGNVSYTHNIKRDKSGKGHVKINFNTLYHEMSGFTQPEFESSIMPLAIALATNPELSQLSKDAYTEDVQAKHTAIRQAAATKAARAAERKAKKAKAKAALSKAKKGKKKTKIVKRRKVSRARAS